MPLPPAFVHSCTQILGSNYSQFEQALHTSSPTSLRLHPLKGEGGGKGDKDAERNGATDEGNKERGSREVATYEKAEKVPWCTQGRYLEERPLFTAQPALHAGAYYVQEASSMLIEQAVLPHVHEGMAVLDLCAAPGGKSTHLAFLLPPKSLLWSNELIRSRAHILQENLCKWGYPNGLITQLDPARLAQLPLQFDLILADVPCSGEGMFRKDPRALAEWSPQAVELCVQRQRRILDESWSLLKPGGYLIYSTCTYNRQENEDNVAWICSQLGAEAIYLDLPSHWGIQPGLDPQHPAYRCFPHLVIGEGFFMALLQKQLPTQAESTSLPGRKKDKNSKHKTYRHSSGSTASVPEALYSYLQNPQDYFLIEQQGYYHAFPKDWQHLLPRVQSLPLLQLGLSLGSLKGKDWLPSHALALSTQINTQAFPVWEVDLPTAQSYLRREGLPAPPATLPKGYLRVVYQGLSLGWVKNIGSRANNLYPKDWKIRLSLEQISAF